MISFKVLPAWPPPTIRTYRAISSKAQHRRITNKLVGLLPKCFILRKMRLRLWEEMVPVVEAGKAGVRGLEGEWELEEGKGEEGLAAISGGKWTWCASTLFRRLLSCGVSNLLISLFWVVLGKGFFPYADQSAMILLDLSAWESGNVLRDSYAKALEWGWVVRRGARRFFFFFWLFVSLHF